MAMKHQINPPPISALGAYNVNLKGSYEAVSYPLVDSETYDGAAGQNVLTFFQNPRGQSGKTYADTNMEAAGQIPNPNLFYMTGIEVLFVPGVNPSITGAALAASGFVNDVFTFYTFPAYLELDIGAKTYLIESPLLKFPPSHRLEGFAAATTYDLGAAAALQTALAGAAGQPFEISPFVLPPNQTFSLTLNWPTAKALPSAQDGKVWVTLNGFMYRPAQ